MLHRFLFILFVCFFLQSHAQERISENNLKKHIAFLASDKMKGRETGSRQVEKAATYIEKQFRQFGLQPKGEKGYRQPFTAKIKKVPVADSLRPADNVIGFLDNGAAKTIVIGAHYDHLGHGTIGGSRDTLNIGQIHNGADDNASGVAGLLELARVYAQNDLKEPFNLLFIAFGAEELGLLGSLHYTEHPVIPLEQVHWMLNMDMIGRYNPENGVAVIGYGTSPAFAEIFEDITSDIKFYTGKDGKGGSDQTSFYLKNIPVLFFHTGGHPDYHKSTDDADKIDYMSLKAILELEINVIDRSMQIEQMEFTPTN
ncbi:M20/M25/M40 family metallo-hydrolase [Crocinitomicaceae bacterium CZZ-1]|uniref:M20/M25/M40 family metallo-hydrolase n=1 Tax=Taishania pollutisoli TaxID=2766479 RepID=A0A8J6P7Q8_9FLAO|nr:M20/M25/M40 family metallo-hydrolase [Taishania pollutisoli]MBC9813609.1 M20/M25/M40 family metallo-hydrolase [Taishania pollutisoli]